MIEAIYAFLIEKAYINLQFTMNIMMRCNCANVSHKAI